MNEEKYLLDFDLEKGGWLINNRMIDLRLALEIFKKEHSKSKSHTFTEEFKKAVKSYEDQKS